MFCVINPQRCTLNLFYFLCSMHVFETKAQVTSFIAHVKAKNKTIGFVPTMGALHNGHASLVSRSVSENDVTIATIFVNRKQFNNADDFARYPKMPDKDKALLNENACDAVFIPLENEMYAQNEELLDLDLGTIDKVMEGEHRPGHFKGVITIVSKFFELVKPSNAYFGEKDFQQLAIIRFMTQKLFPQIKIIGCPTMREADGLAMSSRNLLLTPQNRASAPLIYKTMNEALVMKNTNTVAGIKKFVLQKLSAIHDFKPEYFEIVNAQNLQSITSFDECENPRACIAVWAGNVRLIDNIAF